MRFLCFFLLLIVAFGCGDEGVKILLDPLVVPDAPASGTVTGVPPEIQKMLWGDREALWEEISDILDDGFIETDNGPVRFTGRPDRLLEKICLLDAQRKHYSKYIDAGGIAIIGDRHVLDRFFYAAREIVLVMTSKHPEIREYLLPSTKHRQVLVYGNLWGLVSIPEMSTYFLSKESAGKHGFCSEFCASTVWTFQYEKGYLIMHVFVHEFGHAMHKAIQQIDPTFNDRLEAAYEDALETGSRWGPNDHILSNMGEYWAGGVVEWFYDLTQVEIPEWRANFLETDPLLYALLEEWLPFIHLDPIIGKW